jgi:hypothetical protein
VEVSCLPALDNDIVEIYPTQQLSIAVVKWHTSLQRKCDVIHAHEWGGIYKDLAVHLQSQPEPSQGRLILQAHGGHMWSQHGDQGAY